MVGKFTGIANIGSTSLTGTGDEGFIAKLNSEGQLLWADSYGGSGQDGGLDITVDNSGGIYICGYYGGPATFDTISVVSTGTVSFSSGENFLAKYDSSGNVQWVKHGSKRREFNYVYQSF